MQYADHPSDHEAHVTRPTITGDMLVPGFAFREEAEIMARKRLDALFFAIAREFDARPIELPLVVSARVFLGGPPQPLMEKDAGRVITAVAPDGTPIAIRYEGTTLAAMWAARTAANVNFTGVRLAYFQEMVRLEQTAALDAMHRRCFFQAGMEMFATNPEQHQQNIVDLFAFFARFLRAAGLVPTFRISHARLLPAMLEGVEITTFARRKIIGALEQGSIEEIARTLSDAGVPPSVASTVVEAAHLRGAPLAESSAFLDRCGPRVAALRPSFTKLGEALSRRELDVDCRFDPGVYRGLEFYTGHTFQADAGSVRESLGGGEFAGLAEAFGCPCSLQAVGAAAGIERLLLALGSVHHE
jgi:histidyl-tRNA synthetase